MSTTKTYFMVYVVPVLNPQKVYCLVYTCLLLCHTTILLITSTRLTIAYVDGIAIYVKLIRNLKIKKNILNLL